MINERPVQFGFFGYNHIIVHLNAYLWKTNNLKGMFLVFYDNLKAECDKQGVKVTPLIQECGGSTGTISNWKKGASPNSDIVMKIAVRLNVSTDQLLFGEKKDMPAEITESEQKLLDVFRKLNEKGQIGVQMYAETQADKPQYQKYTDFPKDA